MNCASIFSIVTQLELAMPRGRRKLTPIVAVLAINMLAYCFAPIRIQAQSLSLLHTFDIEDPCDPKPVVEPGAPANAGVLAQGPDGAIYGATPFGGACNASGATYRITTAGAVVRTDGVPGVEHSFVSGEGLAPYGGLTLASDGNYYGTTKSGGNSNLGAVFMMTQAGAVTTLHSFDGTDGAFPTAPPIEGLDGYLYGTTTQGGTFEGVVYKMAPKSPWKLTSFPLPTLVLPEAALLQGSDGYFYGTAESGGTHGFGAVFKMSSSGTISTVYNFTGGTDGSGPVSPLIQGNDGFLYGTASGGGDAQGNGVVFKLSTSGVLTVIYDFHGTTDGKTPLGGLVQASNGDFYGVASGGGVTGDGTLFRVMQQGTKYVFSAPISFTKSSTGQTPELTLLQHTNGLLYGDTHNGGTLREETGGSFVSQGGTFYSVNDSGLTPFVKAIPGGGLVGAPVILLGQGFTAATQVSFDGAAATIKSRTATSLTMMVPSAAVTGLVSVTTGTAVLKSLKSFRVFPAILSFTPTSGQVGSQVSISGTGFSGSTEVDFGNVKATAFTIDSPTRVTATVPAGAKTGRITLKTAGGYSTSTGTFSVLP